MIIGLDVGGTHTDAVLIGDVTDDSPAAKAGLERGDVVTAINGHRIAKPKAAATTSKVRLSAKSKRVIWADQSCPNSVPCVRQVGGAEH